MTRKDLLAHMERLHACEEARTWVAATQGSPSALWASCPRGDWMLWLAGRAEIDRRLLVLAACDCARTVLQHVPAGEDRPRVAIETAEAWCRGEATIEAVRRAYAAAAYAAYAAAAAAAYAADAYAAAAYAAYARTKARRRCARLVAARIPWSAVEAGLRGAA